MENEDMHMALAVSQSLREVEEEQAIQEQSSTELQQAIEASIESLQEEDQRARDLALQIAGLESAYQQLEDAIFQGDSTGSPSQLIETACSPKRIDELPKVYKNYRLEPTFLVDSEMWPPAAVSCQQRELKMVQGNEEVKEWREKQSENKMCVVCMTNVATRVAVPCGHRLCCRTCFSRFVDTTNLYSVTDSDGQILNKDRRMPVQCFRCRAIIGQFITLY